MNEFIIKEVNVDGYNRYLIWLTSESIMDSLLSIETSPNLLNSSGKILIDMLFLTGDEYNRFISCNYNKGKLDFSTILLEKPNDYFKKLTVLFLQENYAYVEHSVLTESQRQCIKEGKTF